MNNVRYKTTRLLKKTSMYRSRYVYDRHYLPTAVCLTYAPQLIASFSPATGPYCSLHFLFKYEIHKKQC